MKNINFINSWREGNKKNIIDFTLRFGILTILEMNWNPTKSFRLIILNLGFQWK
jgi:hypothetical protein